VCVCVCVCVCVRETGLSRSATMSKRTSSSGGLSELAMTFVGSISICGIKIWFDSMT